jgi:hypothetical protein
MNGQKASCVSATGAALARGVSVSPSWMDGKFNICSQAGFLLFTSLGTGCKKSDTCAKYCSIFVVSSNGLSIRTIAVE